VTAAVSVNGVPRLLDRRQLVDIAVFAAPHGAHFIAAAFAPARRRALIEQAQALGRCCQSNANLSPNATLSRLVRRT
jgi:hypothetical protein